MPNRLIKESICYSADIDKLNPFEETVFYRLIVNCDDYGRIDARPEFLKSKLFVTKQGITNKNVEDAVSRLASIGLVQAYEVAGKPFLLFPKWSLHQQIRAKQSKYPAPDNICEQMISDDCECPRNPIQSESESESIYIGENSPEFVAEIDIAKKVNPNLREFDGDEVFDKIYKEYPYKDGKAGGKQLFIGYLTVGRELKGTGKVRLNHLQIYFAVDAYAESVKDTEKRYIKHFDTFMNKPVIDWVESAKPQYEEYMRKKYGENWEKVKFKYKFTGVKHER